MRHITLYTALFTSIFIGWLAQQEISLSSNSNAANPDVNCQWLDSMALVEFYNLTSQGACPPLPAGWESDWILTNPVCSWPGVTLDEDGFVISLIRNNNGLTGNFPVEITGLSRLEVLQLDNNCLTGPIPPEIGNLTNLQTLYLDDNMMSGDLPEELCLLTDIQTIFFDHNGFTGTIPECFNDLDALLRFEIHSNCIDSIPDLSGMLSMQPNRFRVDDNKLTFDDLLPNMDDIGTFYEPQDSFGVCSTLVATTGTSFALPLGIDYDVPNNEYEWFKDGSSYTTTSTNYLLFDPVHFNIAGTYHCQVTNPDFPQLTLYSRCFIIEVECGTSVLNFTPDVCGDYEIEIGGVTYNEANPCGNTTLSGEDQFGCDSIINVCLNFYEPYYLLDSLMCPGESIVVDGVIYNQDNPNGEEILENQNYMQCDSTVEIQLSFYPEATNTISGNYCNDESIEINGTTYTAANPSGTETLDGESWRGCDSILIVSLSFAPAAESNLQEQVCPGQDILVNNNPYNCNNLTGTEVIAGGSYSGCDSTVTIELTCFTPPGWLSGYHALRKYDNGIQRHHLRPQQYLRTGSASRTGIFELRLDRHRPGGFLAGSRVVCRRNRLRKRQRYDRRPGSF